ncbi:MAG: hypothetical protein PHE20_01650 [Patescibacteria group bacterium]|nr:hypothetical protein [Patescibacteria group bacterium]
MSKRTEAVDQLFNLIDNYLIGEDTNQQKCHQALDYLVEGVEKIKECANPELALQFEEKWKAIKEKIKANSEQANFRRKEIEIEKAIKICKPPVKA